MSPVQQSLQLLKNSGAVAAGLQVPCAGSGGNPFAAPAEPYNFQVLAGGAGGTISSAGLYTAPTVIVPPAGNSSSPAVDTIVVTDGSGAMARSFIAVCTPLQLVCDIIRREMGLSMDQVYLYNQKVNIPTDSRLYIAVGVVYDRMFGNNVSYDGTGDDLQAVQSSNIAAQVSIDIFSRGPDALNRKDEVVMALKSVYSAQQQNFNSFGIFGIPTQFLNVSNEDGAAILYRFNITMTVHYFVVKKKSVPYFDTFPTPTILTNP